MKERPIIFNAEMVRAILEGRKTQTRRPVRPQPVRVDNGIPYRHKTYQHEIVCPFGRPGDQLYVRETLANDGGGDWMYEADAKYLTVECPTEWEDRNAHRGTIPSIHMPRWASRITLEIVNVRVERVQEISERGAGKEGVEVFSYSSYLGGFIKLWDSLYGKTFPWSSNPWVWVVEFRRLP